jgi:Holliday junction resolvase RusA-like endonuclease
MKAVGFRVVGVPASQGSKKAFMAGGSPRVREAGGSKHSIWRDAVSQAALRAAEELPYGGPLDGALHLRATFRFPMPKSVPKRLRMDGCERLKRTAPDVSKLTRAVEDSLQAAGLISNDSRIAVLSVAKWEVVGWTGAEIMVEQIEE